ncbi:uncharacterized protein CCR75_002403 [Bremia lactucae]|uniref:Transposase n=1 Tax=Bremia lactucae TaxID=4779 RepID=A0A976IK83_BRELC|nr:hypothetical protein CCR75_002403 [Bremia lactucae]
MIIEKVIPAIRSKWPNSTGSAAFVIQQDNTKPHISPSDITFNEVAQAFGMDIQLSCQPLKRPDKTCMIWASSMLSSLATPKFDEKHCRGNCGCSSSI